MDTITIETLILSSSFLLRQKQAFSTYEAASHKNSLEMQVLKLRPTSTESKIEREGFTERYKEMYKEISYTLHPASLL
jgi:hypothetical protein